jgi:hypothetical protein
MSMASEAAEERFRQAVYAEAKRTGRPFTEIWQQWAGRPAKRSARLRG